MMNLVLVVGAFLGLMSVIFGATAEHVLFASVPAEVLRSVETAIRYHQIGALMITGLGLVLLRPLEQGMTRLLKLSALLFAAGTLLFSFSIYLAAFLEISALARMTPLGGISLMAAWAVLVWAGVRGIRES